LIGAPLIPSKNATFFEPVSFEANQVADAVPAAS
jgi:hypothetical protein